MKANLKTTFERYGKRIVGHIEDAEMYEEVKNGTRNWKEHMYSRITHVEIPKDVYERLLELDKGNQKQSEGEWIDKPTGAYGRWQSWCSSCGKHSGIGGIESNRHKPFCPNCGAKMKGV